MFSTTTMAIPYVSVDIPFNNTTTMTMLEYRRAQCSTLKPQIVMEYLHSIRDTYYATTFVMYPLRVQKNMD